MLDIEMFLFVLCLEIGRGMIRFSLMMLTERRGVLGAFLSNVGSKFRAIDRTSRLYFLSFFLGEFRYLCGVNFLRLFRFFFCFVLFENSAARQSIGFCFFGSFFMFGFGEIGG